MIYHTSLFFPGLTALPPSLSGVFFSPSWSALDHYLSLYKQSFCIANRSHIPLIAVTGRNSQVFLFFFSGSMQVSTCEERDLQPCPGRPGPHPPTPDPVTHLWKTSHSKWSLCLPGEPQNFIITGTVRWQYCPTVFVCHDHGRMDGKMARASKTASPNLIDFSESGCTDFKIWVYFIVFKKYFKRH